MTLYLGSDWVSSSRHPQPQLAAVGGLRTLTPFISSSPPPDGTCCVEQWKRSSYIQFYQPPSLSIQLKIKGIYHIITTLDTNTIFNQRNILKYAFLKSSRSNTCPLVTHLRQTSHRIWICDDDEERRDLIKGNIRHMQEMENARYKSTGGGAPVTGNLTISHPSTQRNIVS